MSTTLTIDPITRIEGHARITIQLDDAGDVADAHFHVTQFRGFEKLCEGRPFAEMPSLMARICGICPVSHLVAAAKACDRILAVRPPKTGSDLRALMNLAQIVQSHSLSLFYLAAPDLVFGFDSDPATRNIVGIARTNPQLALEVAQCQRLVKGYSDTHERGLRNFETVMTAFEGSGGAMAPATLRELREAALADEHGNKLKEALARVPKWQEAA